MPDGLALALEVPGLWWLIAVTFVAGLTYGFAGFGAAMIAIPLAAIVIDTALAVAAFSVSAIVSLVTLVPRAWPRSDRAQVLGMAVVASLTMPLGIWLLRSADETALRIVISAIVALTLVALLAGWRLAAPPGAPARIGVAAGTGLVGGSTGLVGPIVILFNLAAPGGAERARANTLVFLTLSSLLIPPQMALQGALPPVAIWLGLLLVLPYGAGGLLGQALFDPARERLYRRVAYAIVGAAALLGLPVFG